MSSPLITPMLTFDRAAIMRSAHAEARAMLAGHVRLGCKPWPYALAFKHALRSVWGDARVYHDCANREARLAKASLRERAIADLENARFAAQMIDSTARMRFEVASIDAELVALQAVA